MGHQSGWRHEPGNYKACPNEAVTSFLCLHKRSVWNCPCLIWCCLLVFNYSEMASKQQQAFRMCVHPCLRYLLGGDTHVLCIACLGEEHTRSALESAGCEHCKVLPLRSSLRSPGLWSCCCRGTAKAEVLGYTNRSVSEVRDGLSLISAFTWQVQCLVSEARAVVSSAPIEA